jgi:hypothetical protein
MSGADFARGNVAKNLDATGIRLRHFARWGVDRTHPTKFQKLRHFGQRVYEVASTRAVRHTAWYVSGVPQEERDSSGTRPITATIVIKAVKCGRDARQGVAERMVIRKVL